jgi:hypothetical protein
MDWSTFFNLDILYSKVRCHVISKVFSISKNTAALDMLLLKFKLTWSVSLIHRNVVLWRARKQTWLVLRRHLSPVCLLTIFRKTFSNSLPAMDKRLIGRKFLENLGSLPEFDNVITFASFQGFGKWESRRQWLNKCARCTSGSLGRCPRHSFGIRSRPEPSLFSVNLLIYVYHRVFIFQTDIYQS